MFNIYVDKYKCKTKQMFLLSASTGITAFQHFLENKEFQLLNLRDLFAFRNFAKNVK